jgi:hypothetical protein
MLPCLVSVLLTFEIEGVLKFEKIIRRQKVNPGPQAYKGNAKTSFESGISKIKTATQTSLSQNLVVQLLSFYLISLLYYI